MRSYRMNLGVFFLIASVVGCVQNHYPSDPFVGSPLTEGPRVVPGQPVENIDELTTETFTEDDLSHGEKEVQKLTDNYVKYIDDHLSSKEEEILTV